MGTLVMWVLAMGLILAIPKMMGHIVAGLSDSLKYVFSGILKMLAHVMKFISWLASSPIRLAVTIAKAVHFWFKNAALGYKSTKQSKAKKNRFKSAMKQKEARSSMIKQAADAYDSHFYQATASIKTIKMKQAKLLESELKLKSSREDDANMAVPTCIRKGIFQTDSRGDAKRDGHGNPIKVSVVNLFQKALDDVKEYQSSKGQQVANESQLATDNELEPHSELAIVNEYMTASDEVMHYSNEPYEEPTSDNELVIEENEKSIVLPIINTSPNYQSII
ncbi:hypothetical protein [Vibrio sp. 1180_3]|uniref:hypothetical protein n=1 Tax=Vibrio sp. 1180_3 TaxID=2528832 RepID=UPI002405B2DC|nr:hypothetical protein [Vibrio sp. 1180_3]MDF9399115.1 hypothetical protein [Vibrio sp. 1180_3]